MFKGPLGGTLEVVEGKDSLTVSSRRRTKFQLPNTSECEIIAANELMKDIACVRWGRLG